jgi:hypothetical protein
MERKQLISNKSFERTIIRFNIKVNEYIGTLDFNDISLSLRIQNILCNQSYNIFNSLINEYKMHPFRKYSAFTYKLDNNPAICEIKMSYTLEDDKLVFKFATKKQYKKFKRKVDFTLKI